MLFSVCAEDASVEPGLHSHACVTSAWVVVYYMPAQAYDSDGLGKETSGAQSE